MHEWPLLLFTILLQTAAGGFAALCLMGKPDDKTKESLVLSAVAIAAVGCSLAHLGDMAGAYRALSNVASSWLSREVWLAGGFVACAVLACVRACGGRAGLLFFLAACLGLLAVYASSAVYATTAIDKWAQGRPALAFFASTFLLGPALLPLIRSCSPKELRVIALLIGLGVVFLLASIGFSTAEPGMAFVRCLLSAVGILLAFFIFIRQGRLRLAASLSLLCLLAGEALGRYSFFME